MFYTPNFKVGLVHLYKKKKKKENQNLILPIPFQLKWIILALTADVRNVLNIFCTFRFLSHTHSHLFVLPLNACCSPVQMFYTPVPTAMRETFHCEGGDKKKRYRHHRFLFSLSLHVSLSVFPYKLINCPSSDIPVWSQESKEQHRSQQIKKR